MVIDSCRKDFIKLEMEVAIYLLSMYECTYNKHQIELDVFLL